MYIGDTRESPEERFHKHITDYRKRRGGVRTSNADVRRRGKRLAYELFEHINPLAPEVDACERAKKLRLELEGDYEIRGSSECMEQIMAARRARATT